MIHLAMAALTAAVISGVATAAVLRQLQQRGVAQSVRDDGPASHLEKANTPTMGGLAIIFTLVVVALLCGHALGIIGPRAYLVTAVTIAYALVGLLDDLAKTTSGKPTGWLARYKILAELLLAVLFLAGVIYVASSSGASPSQGHPSTQWHSNLLWLWASFGVFVVVGGANAVNLTDGLDGLAAGLTAICAMALAAILHLAGDTEMALMAVVVAGAAAGFLWLNAHPAQIFMGDVGSLGLGTALAAIAVTGRIEWLFGLTAAVFVWEALSVIIQVVWFKRTGGKRIFRMAPFHHHLELAGWAEPTVVVRLWLIGAACALLAIIIATGGLR
jgi:phospho-N-acetylmuramoyl-pentapeptide-transferase